MLKTDTCPDNLATYCNLPDGVAFATTLPSFKSHTARTPSSSVRTKSPCEPVLVSLICGAVCHSKRVAVGEHWQVQMCPNAPPSGCKRFLGCRPCGHFPHRSSVSWKARSCSPCCISTDSSKTPADAPGAFTWVIGLAIVHAESAYGTR